MIFKLGIYTKQILSHPGSHTHSKNNDLCTLRILIRHYVNKWWLSYLQFIAVFLVYEILFDIVLPSFASVHSSQRKGPLFASEINFWQTSPGKLLALDSLYTWYVDPWAPRIAEIVKYCCKLWESFLRVFDKPKSL